MSREYLHGYTRTEQERLIYQAGFLEHFVYKGIDLSQVRHLLEVGSGVGAQTEILLRRFPHLKITCVDISEEQIALAQERLAGPLAAGQVKILRADATDLSALKDGEYDAGFLCWFLEHVLHPLEVLREVKKKVISGGEIILTEVNNSSLFLDPYAPCTLKYWYEFNDYQWNIQGHPFVGLQLGNLLTEADFKDIHLDFRPMHFDHQDPIKKREFLDYFFGIFNSASDSLVKKQRVPPEMIHLVKAEFERAKTDPRGVFYYSFVRATARS
jgi:ubiquinone/menaquinone biosynthesis C-methylase UbiE